MFQYTGAASASAGAAAAAAIAQAVKASGAIVRMEVGDFLEILARSEAPLVVRAAGGLFRTRYEYLTGYRGLIFHTKSPEPLELPPHCEMILAKRIWIPA